ncbi:MAG: phage Gp37/Gp68 family protein, partial [Planctomycetes bacterium]|nr:phage Gp37/Gp68 family protein [Planctomycetota bacterium]
MADRSAIEWTDATWNPVAGCAPVSPGCLNCYAARLALRLSRMGLQKYANTVVKSRDGRPVFSGNIFLDHESLETPLRWREPRRVFVNSMSDLFHEYVPLYFVERVFAVMGMCKQHVFQILTKRPNQALALSPQLDWASNVWLGASIESRRYLERISVLQRIPAKTRFLSCEPLLGPLGRLPLKGIHWVIAGGESGPKARPMNPEWVRAIRDQCVAGGVPFFF